VEQHPNIDDPVVLRDDADRGFRSRVTDLGNGLLVVLQPADLPGGDAYGTGTPLSVAWEDESGGVTLLPTRILTAHAEGERQLWSLVVAGPAYARQRRRSERVAATGPVKIRPAVGKKSDTVTGSLADVSEGGVRCTVGAGAADRLLTSHDEVIAEFRLGGTDFAVPGRVEFLRPAAHPAQFENAVVVFDEPVAQAEALRTQVLAQQEQTPSTPDQG
jgi:c-di-GMP-binding flagellar brake protein YcgR